MTIQTKNKLKSGTVIMFHETTCEKIEGVNPGDLAVVLDHPSQTRLVVLYKGKKTVFVFDNLAFTGLTNTISVVSEE